MVDTTWYRYVVGNVMDHWAIIEAWNLSVTGLSTDCSWHAVHGAALLSDCIAVKVKSRDKLTSARLHASWTQLTSQASTLHAARWVVCVGGRGCEELWYSQLYKRLNGLVLASWLIAIVQCMRRSIYFSTTQDCLSAVFTFQHQQHLQQQQHFSERWQLRLTPRPLNWILMMC